MKIFAKFFIVFCFAITGFSWVKSEINVRKVPVGYKIEKDTLNVFVKNQQVHHALTHKYARVIHLEAERPSENKSSIPKIEKQDTAALVPEKIIIVEETIPKKLPDYKPKIIFKRHE